MPDIQEIEITHARCYGREVVGCQNHHAFAMLSVINAENNRTVDLFFHDREALEYLRDEIDRVLRGDG